MRGWLFSVGKKVFYSLHLASLSKRRMYLFCLSANGFFSSHLGMNIHNWYCLYRAILCDVRKFAQKSCTSTVYVYASTSGTCFLVIQRMAYKPCNASSRNFFPHLEQHATVFFSCKQFLQQASLCGRDERKRHSARRS